MRICAPTCVCVMRTTHVPMCARAVLRAQVVEKAKGAAAFGDLVKYLLMVRKKQKDSKVDTELVYAYAKTGQMGPLEEFIAGTHQANLQACADRCARICVRGGVCGGWRWRVSAEHAPVSFALHCLKITRTLFRHKAVISRQAHLGCPTPPHAIPQLPSTHTATSSHTRTHTHTLPFHPRPPPQAVRRGAV